MTHALRFTIAAAWLAFACSCNGPGATDGDSPAQGSAQPAVVDDDDRDVLGVNDREVGDLLATPGEPEIRGRLDHDVIQGIVREHQREIRACYEAALLEDPTLAGNVLIGFWITPEGSVTRVSVEETRLNNASAEECMVRLVEQWTFPLPEGGGVVRVSYPFEFGGD